jgi:hypothetical protein
MDRVCFECGWGCVGVCVCACSCVKEMRGWLCAWE